MFPLFGNMLRRITHLYTHTNTCTQYEGELNWNVNSVVCMMLLLRCLMFVLRFFYHSAGTYVEHHFC